MLPKVVRQQFIGEVGKFITFCCQISSECRIPKVIKYRLMCNGVIQNNRRGGGTFMRHRL